MHLSFLLLAGSMFYILLITILYFSKKRIKLLENKIYQYILFTAIIGIVLDFMGIYAHLNLPETSIIRWLIVKLYFVYLLTFIFLLTLYIFFSSGRIGKKDWDNDKRVKRIFNLFLFSYLVCLVLNFILPFEYYNQNDIVYVYGPNATFLYVIDGITMLSWSIFIISHLKKLKKRKYLPMIAFVLISAPLSYVQMTNPELLLVTAVITFVVVFMYHTIENPDLNMINELNIARTQAEKANMAKTNFLSSMSHEIRTPLNAIVGFSECIANADSLDSAKDDAKDVVMASQNLLEIVNGILDLSKIEANKMEIVNTSYQLLPNLENITKLIIPRIANKPIELKTYFAPDIPSTMYGDLGKIKQAITNILTNAAKYTEKGEIDFTVNCINENDVCSLVISIADTGRGIKPEKIDTLFTKFNRLEEDRNTTIEGTGLGLAITKSLIEMIGGKIVVQSVYGQGSRFTIYLKQKIIQLQGGEEVNKVEEDENIEFPNSIILVVDDNNLNLKVADRLLKRHKINTVLVESGSACIDLIKKGEKYDVIFMDDMMPKMSGGETLQVLKQIENFNIPVVALTANAISGMKDKYLADGFDDYLAKPIERPELNRIMKKYLTK